MAYSTATTTPKYVPLGVRVVLTLAGAAGLIVGAFLTWIDGIRGTDLSIDALWRTTFHTTGQFLQTVGFASIAVGLVALLGLAFASGWLTRLAGAVGIVGFALFAIQVFRDSASHTWGLGGWLALAGSVVVLIAGFLGGRRTVVEHSVDRDDVDVDSRRDPGRTIGSRCRKAPAPVHARTPPLVVPRAGSQVAFGPDHRPRSSAPVG